MRKAPETVARPIKVGAAVLGDVRPTKSKSGRPFGVVAKMAREVEALVRHRASADCTSWVRPLADLMAPTTGVEGFVRHVVVIAPHLVQDAAEIAETADAAISARTYWTATKLGMELGLSREERLALGITTIRAVGQTKTTQREAKRANDATRQRAKRREAGRPTRDVWIAESVAEEARRTGVARSTIYRRRASESECNTLVATKEDTIGGDAPVAEVEAGALGRARSPAAALAEIVVRSTGHRPSAVMVEGDQALVLLDPARTREGPVLAPHLAETLRELGITATARFDGRAAIFVTMGREAA